MRKLPTLAALCMSLAAMPALACHNDPGGCGGGGTISLVPNLQPLSAADIRIDIASSGRKLLRFSAINWNSGDGKLELIGGEVDSTTKK